MMRWINRKKIRDQKNLIAKKRVIVKFCFFPRNVGNSTHWLEKITIQQHLQQGPRGDYYWVDVSVIKLD